VTSEATLLLALSRHQHRAALSRRLGGGAVAVGLERLERRGLARRIGGSYRLTPRGQSELELARLLSRALLGSR